MNKRIFIINSFILTSTSLISKTIGMFFRVYMSNKIGAEGIGLYQLICTAYLFVAMLPIAGISVAVTRLVSEYIAKERNNKIKNITKACIIISTLISLITSYLLFSFADKIAIYVIKDTRSILALKILAPSIPFMAISACFRGYFCAVRKVIYTSLEQFLEQVIEIIVFIFILSMLSIKNVEYSCCAIVLGTTAAEIISAAFSFICYIIDVKRYSTIKTTTKNHINVENNSKELLNKKIQSKTNSIFKEIINISLPITLTSCLRSSLSLIENSIIPQGLKKFGSSSHESLAIYGMIIGIVAPFISFPAVFISSFSLLIIPELSSALVYKRLKNINYMTTKILQITFIFSIMIAGIFMFFSNKFSIIVFKNQDVGIYIKLLSPLVPLIYIDSIVDGMLKGLNQQFYSFIYNIIDACVRIIIIYLFLPKYGIKALIIVLFISNILNSSLSMYRLIKVAKININIMDWIFKPILSILIACNLLNIFYQFFSISDRFINVNIIFYITITLASILYITLLILIRCIKHEDILWIKKVFNP